MSDGNPPELTYEDQLNAMSPKVRVVKNEERMGLIKAKMKAVELAEGDVLVFMEAHCIVNRQWLEPLLSRLADAPHALVQPTLDIIPQEHFDQYFMGARGHWRFEWNMNLIFTAPPDGGVPPDAEHLPAPMPATSGGIFAIRRDWWLKLGFYDPEMREWGGDHVEATMKVWRCGGHIEMHPCSRVGHLFRDPEHRPYDVDIPVVVHNYARLAEVWWDNYLPQFYMLKPDAKAMSVGDVSAQRELREQLKCKDMDWYLKYVDPEMEWEASRICIPGAQQEYHGCAGDAIPGRSTVDQTIPAEVYRQRREEITAYFDGVAMDDEDSHEL